MANRRPVHRKGTTGHKYRKLQAWVFRGKVCQRCFNSRGPILRVPCQHEAHQALRYCPTHPLAPSLGHKEDLQYGGRPLDPRNTRLEHFGCNSSAGAKTRAKRPSQKGTHQSWEW